MSIFLDANGKKYKLPPGKSVEWRISVYPLVLNKQREILMVVPTWNNLWELPGGGVEIEESIMEGMVRECLEETGYSIKPISNIPLYIGEQKFYLHQKYFHSVIFVYSAKLTSKKQDISFVNTVEKNEIAKIEWVPVKKLSEKNCHPTIWPAIKLLKKHSKK